MPKKQKLSHQEIHKTPSAPTLGTGIFHSLMVPDSLQRRSRQCRRGVAPYRNYIIAGTSWLTNTHLPIWPLAKGQPLLYIYRYGDNFDYNCSISLYFFIRYICAHLLASFLTIVKDVFGVVYPHMLTSSQLNYTQCTFTCETGVKNIRAQIRNQNIKHKQK